MSLLDKIERALGRFAIPNLALYLVIGQVAVLLLAMMQRVELEKLVYAPVYVMQGEWWRVFSFMFLVPIPRSTFGFVFLAFGWYLFYMMGRALEDHWGTFRFNVYLFVSYALTVVLAFLAPGYPVTNIFILGSVFLAFAYLHPNFELLLFFVLPVKIKWLALITWVANGYFFVSGGLSIRLQIGASVVSFLLFFGGEMLRRLRQGQRSRAHQAEKVAAAEQPRHVCHVCGKTDRSHPELDFRYCSQCAGDQCYCPEHIRNHPHVVSTNDQAAG